MFKNMTYEERVELARNPLTKTNILLKLYEDALNLDIYQVKAALAENPFTPKEVLKNLINENNQGIDFNLSKNINLSENFLLKLSKRPSLWVLKNVAEHKNTSIEALEILSKIQNSQINEIALNHPKMIEAQSNQINKGEILLNKIKNNEEALNNVFEEEDIKEDSIMGKTLIKFYNEVQNQLKKELQEFYKENKNLNSLVKEFDSFNR